MHQKRGTENKCTAQSRLVTRDCCCEGLKLCRKLQSNPKCFDCNNFANVRIRRVFREKYYSVSFFQNSPRFFIFFVTTSWCFSWGTSSGRLETPKKLSSQELGVAVWEYSRQASFIGLVSRGEDDSN